jgi:hypothetical protein
MTVPNQETPLQQPEENKPSDKELNFRKQEQMFQRQLEQERSARIEAEKKAQELIIRMQQPQEADENDSEPFVDHKKLNNTLKKFSEQTRQQTQTEIQQAVRAALQDERRQNWIKNNPDFYEVMQHAEKFAQKDPDLAESILEMPEGFERQKLVYKNIKALGLHKPETKQSTIQEKVDANKKSSYYQPGGVGSAPYAATGDFSPAGQKNAFAKMQELKNRLRI